MKKVLTPLFSAVFLLLFGFFFQLSAAAAEEPVPPFQKDLFIDGVYYHLSWANVAGATAYLQVPEDYTGELPDEITVRNEITWDGITFEVDSFSSGDSYDSIGHLTKRKTGTPTYYQQHLKKITVEEGVSPLLSLSHYEALEEIIIESSSQTIQANMSLWDCPKLKDIHVPSNVDLVPHLRDCPNASAVYTPEHPKYQTIDGDIYSKNGKLLYDVPATTKKYTVRKGVERIESNAFAGNGSIKKIFLPNSVRKIKSGAFFNMQKLKKVKYGNNIKKIYGKCFQRTPNLKVLTLPASVRQITSSFGTKKFSGLKKIYINSPKLNKADFSGVPKTCKIYVKNNAVKNMIRKQSKFKGQIIVK